MKIKKTEISVVKADIARVRAGSKVKAPAASDETKVRLYYRRALARALRRSVRSVAFEASAQGLSETRARATAKILAQEIFRQIHEGKKTVAKVAICAQDNKAYEVFRKYSLGYIDYIANRLKSPFLCVDVIIHTPKGMVIIKRSNPPFGWALPGGFVDYGESLEEAVAREAREETGLYIKEVKQFHTYSRPGRDPRFHTVSTVFTAKAAGVPRAGSDAAGIRCVKPDEISALKFAFDHKKIIREYLSFKEGKVGFVNLKKI